MKAATTLSSSQTFFLKFIFPTVWTTGFVIGTVTLFSSSKSDAAAGAMALPFLLITICGALFLWWTCIPLKRVRMDDGALYISNYSDEITVPLSSVAEVTENVWLNIHPVTIRFRTGTEFGSQIVFAPKARAFAFFSSHPVVAEIRNAVARATG